VRHALRAWFLRCPPPRLREFRNLTWLAGHGFQAVRPLVAGSLARGGAVWLQFLVTEEVPQSLTLDVALEGLSGAPQRAAVLDELADEVARMHALGFVHRDLYPRNLLVGSGERRVHFLDAWAGGPRARLRGPAYDLGCLMLEGARLFSRDEQQRFFERYLTARAAHDRPERAQPFQREVRAARRAQVARLLRRPARQRGAQLPDGDWPGFSLSEASPR